MWFALQERTLSLRPNERLVFEATSDTLVLGTKISFAALGENPMKFKSQVFTQVSGSVGGLTYAHNRGGMYTRARSIPVNPSSTSQTVVRANLATLVTYWGTTLTDAQRTAWNNYAANSPVTDKFGDSMLLSGQQMFVRCNSVRLRGGAGIVAAGPVTYGMATITPPQIAASIGAGSLFAAFSISDAWRGENGAGLVVQTSRFVGAGISFLKSPYRFLLTIDGDSTTPPASPYDLGAETAFGQDIATAVVGQRIFGRFVAFRADGRISPTTIFNGSVIA